MISTRSQATSTNIKHSIPANLLYSKWSKTFQLPTQLPKPTKREYRFYKRNSTADTRSQRGPGRVVWSTDLTEGQTSLSERRKGLPAKAARHRRLLSARKVARREKRTNVETKRCPPTLFLPLSSFLFLSRRGSRRPFSL